MGRLATGSRGLGRVRTRGTMWVSCPPARMTAFTAVLPPP